MGLKKRSRVSAEFNMSSLTDIIFLLLIFFMLTSTVVAPNALNLKLPGRADTPATPSTNQLAEVRIDDRGDLYYQGKRISIEQLEDVFLPRARSEFNFIIAPTKDAPVEGVVKVMDLAMRLDINGILAAEE